VIRKAKAVWRSTGRAGCGSLSTYSRKTQVGGD